MKVLLSAAALLLLIAPSAAANSQLFVTGYELPRGGGGELAIVGPRPAGESVVWGERMGRRVHLRSLASDGRATDIGSVVDIPRGADNPFFLELTADDGRLAFSQVHTTCVLECRDFRVVDTELRLGSVGGPYTVVASCEAGESDCPEECVYRAPVLAGGMLSRTELCGAGHSVTSSRFVTRDLATGQEFAFEPPGPAPFRAAGPYVAGWDCGDCPPPAREDIVVRDIRTGDEVYRVADQTSYFALNEEGLLALFDSQSGQLAWADQSEPFPHPIAQLAPTSAPRLMARRRAIAVVTPGGAGISRRYSIFNLAGQGASQLDTDPTGEAGFDGRRLAWLSSPCRIAILRVWDPLDEPPELANARCPAAVPRAGSSKVNDRGRIFIDTSCPPRPLLGCTGTLRLVATAGGRRSRRAIGQTKYALASGEKTRLKVELTARQRQFVQRQRHVKAIAVSKATRRPGFESREQRHFRFDVAWRER